MALSHALPAHCSHSHPGATPMSLATRLMLREHGGLFAPKTNFAPFSRAFLPGRHVAASVLQPRRLPQHYQSDITEDLLSFHDAGIKVVPTACAFGKGSNADTLVVADVKGIASLVNASSTRTSDFETPRVCWHAHKDMIFDIAWLGSTGSVVTAAGDRDIKLWDLEKSTCMTFSGHTSSVKSVRGMVDDNNIFVSGSRDGSVMVWDKRTSMCYDSIPSKDGFVKRYYNKPSNEIRIAHSSAQHPLGCGKRTRRTHRQPLRVPSVTSTLFLRDGRTIVSAGDDGTIRFWDARKSYIGFRNNPVPIQTITPASGCSSAKGIVSLDIDDSGTRLIAGCLDNRIYMFDLNHPSCEPAVFSGHAYNLFSQRVMFSPDNQYILSASSDKSAYIWDVHHPEQAPYVLSGHDEEVLGVAWSSNSDGTIATTSDDGFVRLWHSNFTPLEDRPAHHAYKYFTSHPASVSAQSSTEPSPPSDASDGVPMESDKDAAGAVFSAATFLFQQSVASPPSVLSFPADDLLTAASDSSASSSSYYGSPLQKREKLDLQ